MPGGAKRAPGGHGAREGMERSGAYGRLFGKAGGSDLSCGSDSGAIGGVRARGPGLPVAPGIPEPDLPEGHSWPHGVGC